MNLHSTSITATITTAATALAALIGPSPARAQSLPEGMFAEGHASMVRNWGDSSPLTFATADFDIGWRPGSGGTIPLGFALGVEAFNSSTSSGSTGKIALYPTLTYEVSPALSFSAGVPRFVSSRNGGYLESDSPFYSDLFALNVRLFYGSTAAASYLLNSGSIQPYGLRLDYGNGSLALGASYHHIDSDSGDDADVIALAASHEMAIAGLSEARIFASYERISQESGGNFMAYRIGFAGKYGPVHGALTLGRFDPPSSSKVTTAELNATWDVSEGLSARASVLAIDFPTGSSTLYGLGAKYRFNKWASLQASAYDSDAGGFDPRYELGFSVDF